MCIRDRPLHRQRITPEYAAFVGSSCHLMNLHEYQSKQLFAKYGIPVPTGYVAANAEEAAAAAQRIGGAKWVVKAQVHAGGRGKGGGVKLVDTPEAAGKAAAAMIGTRLKTHQTGPCLLYTSDAA